MQYPVPVKPLGWADCPVANWWMQWDKRWNLGVDVRRVKRQCAGIGCGKIVKRLYVKE